MTTITSYKKSSPMKNDNGEDLDLDLSKYKNIQQIITNDFDNNEVSEVVEKLKNTFNVEVEKSNIHNKGKHKGHFHIFLKHNNEKIHKNSIYKVLNEIKKDIEIEKENEKMITLDILDNSLKSEYVLDNKQLKELKELKENEFYFIKDNKEKEMVLLEGFKGLNMGNNPSGLPKNDRPWNILNGIRGDKSTMISRVNLSLELGTLENNFDTLENIDYEKYFKSYLNKITKEENNFTYLNYKIDFDKENQKINISFNNLFEIKNSGNIYVYKKEYLQHMIEETFEEVSNENNLHIESDFKWKSENTISQNKEEKNIEEPLIKTNEKPSYEEPKEDFTFTNNVKGKNIEELGTMEQEIIKNIEKLKLVEGLIEKDLLEKRLNEETNKLSIIKKELGTLEQFNKLENDNKVLSSKVEEVNEKNEKLENDNKVLSSKVEEVSNENERITKINEEQNIKIKESIVVIKEQKEELTNLKENIIIIEKKVVKLEEDLSSEKDNSKELLEKNYKVEVELENEKKEHKKWKEEHTKLFEIFERMKKDFSSFKNDYENLKLENENLKLEINKKPNGRRSPK